MKIWERVNTGICLMPKSAISLELSERLIAAFETSAHHPQFFEQTLYAVMASALNQGGMLPSHLQHQLGILEGAGQHLPALRGSLQTRLALYRRRTQLACAPGDFQDFAKELNPWRIFEISSAVKPRPKFWVKTFLASRDSRRIRIHPQTAGRTRYVLRSRTRQARGAPQAPRRRRMENRKGGRPGQARLRQLRGIPHPPEAQARRDGENEGRVQQLRHLRLSVEVLRSLPVSHEVAVLRRAPSFAVERGKAPRSMCCATLDSRMPGASI